MKPSEMKEIHDLRNKNGDDFSAHSLRFDNELSRSDKSSLINVISPYICKSQKPDFDTPDINALSVRAKHPIPLDFNLYYFEIKISNEGGFSIGHIGIGLSSENSTIDAMPGWEKHTIGYHGDDGWLYNENSKGKRFGPTFGLTDVIGCGVDFMEKTVFFTKNGELVGIVSKELANHTWYPMIGIRAWKAVVKINFGQEPFSFNIAIYNGKFSVRYKLVFHTCRRTNFLTFCDLCNI